MELLIPLLFIPFFALLWVGVTGLISVIGGWRDLAQSNPMPAQLLGTGVTYSFQSMRIGFLGGYNSVLKITVYPQGISIVPIILFSIFHKPLFMSYSAMGNAEFGRFLVPYVTFDLSGRKIRIMGRCVPAIKEKLGPR
ncbi:MAG TPA: hypothetical protein PLM53_07920 [Spirochaetota bacterium]|nr:hypothetical protein [Spirochaetota bacterium]HPC41284.1 hypothetical protein [Spirochaetota bacterium]HPL15098.1 hypothetical protein [Spirochaetota bacterium]HQF08105.1 hypothetical protein [Spirochaetota bacterium]HQH97008.1 hypothetical protein [Spirochaetota bacterium]